jgi:hypothetical protein
VRLQASPARAPTQPALVLDVRLALGSHGLRAATELSRINELWLPQRLDALLRMAPRQRSPADAFAPRAGAPVFPGARAWPEVGEELALWERLPEDPDLAALPLFHLGERADDCRMPPWADRSLRERCEWLQAGLDEAARAAGAEPRPDDDLAACFRDATALAAALPYEAYILTRLDSDGAPAIAAQLEEWGVPVHEASAQPATPELRASLAAAGVSRFSLAGLRIAALIVAVPGIPVLGAPLTTLSVSQVASLWRRASVVWLEV